MMAPQGGGPGKHGPSQDFELNLASIIDCFTVLILYLLVSVSFISMSSFDVSLADTGSQGKAADEPSVSLKARLNADHTIRLELSGPRTESRLIEARDGDWDLKAFSQAIQQHRDAYPSLESVEVLASQTLKYSDLVRGIEAARASAPSVVLNGQEVQ